MPEKTIHHFEIFASYVPFDLANPKNLISAFFVLLAIILFRYFLFAGAFWFAFYRLRLSSRLLYPALPSAKEQWAEIRWSAVTSLVFAIFGVLLGLLWQNGIVRLYLSFDEFGWWYLPLSFLLLALLHDIYFYFTHRWMHWPRVFRAMHQVHHRSLTPSPWASFSFHPLEALLQALALPLILLFLPVHPLVLIAYLTLMTLSAIVNHLGFEVLPRSRLGLFLGRHLITGLHHSAHHHVYRSNYALYFTALDRAFGTEHPLFETDLRKRLLP